MPGPDWLYLASAALLAAAGLPLLVWALWWDRPKGRRRCPRCWYDMQGSSSLVCPECGLHARSERRLLKTRRRWKSAAVALLVLITSGASALTPRVRRHGPWSICGVTVILGLESAIGPDVWPSLTRARQDLLIDPARPPFSRWQLRSLLERHLRDEACLRDCWPVGLPLWASRSVADRGKSPSIILVPQHWTLQMQRPAPSHESFMGVLGGQISGSEQAEVLRYTALGAWAVDLGDDPLVITIPIRRVANIDEAIRPVRDPSVDDAIKKTLAPRLIVYQETQRVGIALTQPTLARRGERSGASLTLGLTITIEHEGKEVARTRTLTRTTELVGDLLLPSELEGDIAAVIAADASDPAWTVRIKGDGEMALRDFRASEYWAGEWILPLGEVNK